MALDMVLLIATTHLALHPSMARDLRSSTQEHISLHTTKTHQKKLVQATFQQIRDQIRPGDVIVFSGKSHVSGLIRLLTRSNASHVGVVIEAPTPASSGLMVESTAETILPASWHGTDEPEGVLISKIDQRLASYEGEIWLLPLSDEARAQFDWNAFREFVDQQNGKGYDRWQMLKLMNAPLFHVPLLGHALRNRENLKKLFCSELVTAALRSAGVVGNVNPSDITPRQVASFPIYADEAFQLKGKPEALAGIRARFQIDPDLSECRRLALHTAGENPRPRELPAEFLSTLVEASVHF